ncbi:MAG TPA: hypothetical protein VGC06_03855, partial [Actinomycetes bacterium]
MRTRRGVRAVLLVAALASVVWPLRPAAASTPNRHQLAGAQTGVLVLVRRLTWDQAAAVAGRHGSPVTAGLVSTLPAGVPLEDRVLSLAAGRQVHADGLRVNEEAPDDVGVAAADRLRAANPDADFGGLPPPRVLAEPGMAATGLLALGAAGAPPPPAVLPASGALLTVPGQLLVVGVADAWGLGRVLGRLESPSPGGGRPRVLVVGLEPPPGRARTAPLLEFLGARLPGGVATSDSTRRDGLVAYQDVRPTLTGLTGSASGTQGAPIRSLPNSDPLGFVGHLDRQVAALVEARGPAVVLYAALSTIAMAVCLAALLLALPRARRPAWAAG